MDEQRFARRALRVLRKIRTAAGGCLLLALASDLLGMVTMLGPSGARDCVFAVAGGALFVWIDMAGGMAKV